MEFNSFDIVEAHYLFLTQYHEGQGSKKYSRLSKITTYFKPAPSGITLTENGLEIYNNLVAHEQEKTQWNV
mgnify:CR=1 FL=1|tara:strand:- start:1076 stop:1288 length:213 start_codon:yes stop_codon:yes gene_type:complete